MGDQKVVTIIDSGTTYNFVVTTEATRLGLKVREDGSKLKVVNNKT